MIWKKAFNRIFATENIKFLQGWYENVLSASGDHPWIWSDFTITSILEGGLEVFTHPITQKLSCKLPKVTEGYQELLNTEFKGLDLDKNWSISKQWDR